MTVPVIADATPAAAREAMARGRPVVFRGLTKEWPAELASLEALRLAPFVANQGSTPSGPARQPDRLLAVRLHRRDAGTVWEGDCVHVPHVRLDQICAWIAGDTPTGALAKFDRAEYVAYSDYQDMNLIFAHAQDDVLRKISWAPFGVDLDGERSTMWLGTEGAHTPTHYDSYGSNLVAQLSGIKRWRLHPPSSDAPGLRPNRVPYEESSIFAYEVDGGAGDESALSVDLQAGECLFVPKHWWHNVCTVSPYALSINTWVDADDDKEDQLREAVARTVACALLRADEADHAHPCTEKDLAEAEENNEPPPRPRPWLNPTEEVWTHESNLDEVRHRLDVVLGCHGPGGMCMKRSPVTTQEVVNALCTGRALEEAVAALLRKRDDDHYARPEHAKKARREEAIPEQWRRPN